MDDCLGEFDGGLWRLLGGILWRGYRMEVVGCRGMLVYVDLSSGGKNRLVVGLDIPVG